MKKLLSIILLSLAINFSSAQEIGLKIGDIAPELAYNNPTGNQLKLSSLKYTKANFKNGKGFEIFSLSLDKSNKAWVKAINKDELFWEYHVSDLGGWQSAGSQKYGIRSIPSNVLIDGDGIIIAHNLKGAALNRFLESQKK